MPEYNFVEFRNPRKPRKTRGAIKNLDKDFVMVIKELRKCGMPMRQITELTKLNLSASNICQIMKK